MAETTTRYYGTGHRKNATAKVWLSSGPGNITVNNRTTGQYFGRASLEALIMQPFEVTETVGRFDVFIRALGGGISDTVAIIVFRRLVAERCWWTAFQVARLILFGGADERS